MIGLMAGMVATLVLAAPPDEPRARFSLAGPLSETTRNVTRRWLLEAPAANPALLGMFRDRDRPPARDLLPWSGEFAGKYLTGSVEILNLTDDPALEDHLRRFVADFVACQDADGYLGPFPRDHRLTGTGPNIAGKPGGTWDAWGHYHALLGLLAYSERTGDPAALAAATKIGNLFCDRFLGDKKPRLVDTGWTEMNLAPAHGLLLLHRRTGDGRHRDLADQFIAEFAALDPAGKPMAGDYFRQGLAGVPFFKTPRPRWESLHPILALAERHRVGGNPDDRRAFENLWWSIVETDRHNNGGFSSGEQAQGHPEHPGAIETCCTIAWMAMSVEMLRMTGDPLVADELELSTLNSALGLFAPSGRWSTYNTPMDGRRLANFHEIGFQCRAGSPELNCCSVNAARGLGLLSRWAVGADQDGLTLNWYGPGRIVVTVPTGPTVTLTQATTYPADPAVRIAVDPDRPAAFPLRLRIPRWSARTTVAVNGTPVPGVTPGRYLVLDRPWKAGDEVAITFDFAPRAWAGEREFAGKSSIYRGPLLLASDPRFDPADLPNLSAASLSTLAPVAWDGPAPRPILLLEGRSDGRPFRLCDFASAGADGSAYRSWLPVEGIKPTPFDRSAPGRTSPVP
ncbi:beta-L-arabinofuranosidase domain-containing protein [Tundrisphaera sp. TA3]|uniref:beta-L-arabinofuranosidase domain-containing protein n=1 Tax=Tundrisphaera sp. TA3 TaxID=3435775 RepID=UPI003EBDE06E